MENKKLKENWPRIRKHFVRCLKSSHHFAISSITKDGYPTVTPIGSLFLNKDQTGYYFEKYTSQLPIAARTNPDVCVMAVNTSVSLWLRSLWKGQFTNYPMIKLYGTLGERRKASQEEYARFERLIKPLKWLKGYDLLWGRGSFDHVREIQFHDYRLANLGKMTLETSI